MIPLILGSQSPRRREILSFFSYPFSIAHPPFDEEAVPFAGDPIEHASILACGKATTLLPFYPQAAILAADTLVFHEGKLYGKPTSELEAGRFLQELSGRWHSVFTAVAVHYRSSMYQLVEETKVLFNSLTEEQIAHYRHTVTWHDKAGGCCIQNSGALLVRKIEGCFYNVLGLPINAVATLLRTIGIDLWHHLS